MKDKKIENLIRKEKKRQNDVINLIASENYVSEDVLKALGNEFTNKYAEGYPGKRYYGGTTVIDELEREVQKRALQTFSLNEKQWDVNVQALSGTPAIIATLLALVPVGSTILSMDLQSGGHLSHGHPLSLVGKLYNIVSYSPYKESGGWDEEKLLKLAKKHKPKVIIAGYSAYPRLVPFLLWRRIARKVGAHLLGDISHIAGLVAGGAIPSPFRYCDVVVTTTHKTLRGPRSALIFSRKEFSEKIKKAVFPGIQGGPHMNQIAAVGVALKEAQTKEFKLYAKQVLKNAEALSSEFQRLGWKIITGGTDTHMVLLDVRNTLGIDGDVAQKTLEEHNIIVNKNLIQNDPGSAQKPSAIRLGSAAETTRGKKEKEFRNMARKIDHILRNSTDNT
jgi:glycine hydroxymethyltransferase